MVTIIDYGMGNLGSVSNMFKKIGHDSQITSNREDILEASKILLPGVGSFDSAMKNLEELGLIDLIKQKVLTDKTPILGICLGMQLLTTRSEEGDLNGLGLVDANVEKFNFNGLNKNLPVPHMGWNEVEIKKESKLIQLDEQEDNRYYFVHSYAIKCRDEKDILTTTNYGGNFVSSFEKNNILGCQFHPEKSHKFGMKIFKNFVDNY